MHAAYVAAKDCVGSKELTHACNVMLLLSLVARFCVHNAAVWAFAWTHMLQLLWSLLYP